MKDVWREISDEFLASLRDGELSELTRLVRKDENLIMCFRKDYINIYYMSHSILKIKEQTTGYKCGFNLGHARYTEPEKGICTLNKILRDYNIDEVDEEKIKNKKDKYFYFTIKKETQPFDFKPIVQKYKEFVDDFFKEDNTFDYFKGEDKKISKSGLIEKKHQQKLFSDNFSLTGKYLYCDLELAVPKGFQEGSPDCIALRLEDGIVKAVVLVEVKSTEAACNGGNGIHKHSGDFDKIISNPEYEQMIKDTTHEMIRYYQELGLLPESDIQYADNVGFEKLFVFTTKEVRKWCEKKQKNQNWREFKNLSDEEKLFYEWQ